MSNWRVFTVLTIMLISTRHRSSGSVSVGANVGIPDLFKPSSEYHYVKQSYPYYLDEYQYRQLSMDKNYLDDEDEEEIMFDLAEVSDLDEIDRQVGLPGVVDDGGPLFGDLTPLLFTSALVVGLSAVFNNVVNLNSTASNASVPFGLWALPELPIFPNLTLPGRKKRSVRGDNLDNFLDNQEDLVGEDFKSQIVDKIFGDLSEEQIAKNFKNAVRTMALMENTQCQAALGCR